LSQTSTSERKESGRGGVKSGKQNDKAKRCLPFFAPQFLILLMGRN
jgi:hypothetical protein